MSLWWRHDAALLKRWKRMNRMGCELCRLACVRMRELYLVSRWRDVQLFIMHVLLNLFLITTWPIFMFLGVLFLTQTLLFFLCFSFSPSSSHAYAAPDVDECLTQQHNCSRGTTCVNTGGGFQCVNPECPHLHGNISYVKTSPLWVPVHTQLKQP